MGNSEVVLKIDKKLVSRVLVLVAGLLTFHVPDVSSDVNSRNMIRNKAKISTRKHSLNGALYVVL